MINKDGGGDNFSILWGEHSCYEGGHRAHGGPPSPPTRENPAPITCLCSLQIVKRGMSQRSNPSSLTCLLSQENLNSTFSASYI